MAVPKRRISRSREGKRRSHQRLAVPPLVYCRKCGTPILAHRVCPKCGYHRGRTVLKVKDKEA